MAPTIAFDHISKYYRLRAGQTNLREAVTSLPGRLVGRKRQAQDSEGHWALKDVSFSLDQGNVIGLIGPNGAGKTTALKIISGVTRPTSGTLTLKGRISALIELGAGFHPDLTGRENIFLNGSILGLSQKEVRQKFDSIVAFAEMEKFIDTPVKRYSSGMYARLGFAVAAHVDPDILLVDEVLAVGDINFQQKCYDFIHNFVTSGKTTVFVSHNLYALEQLCDQLVWLNSGQVMLQGPTQKVLAAFMEEQDRKISQVGQIQNEDHSALRIQRAYVTGAGANTSNQINTGEDLIVHLDYQTLGAVRAPHFVLAVWDVATRQPICMASMLNDLQAPPVLDGQGTLTCRFKAPPLMPRAYQIWGEVYGEDRKNLLIQWQPLCGLTICDPREGESLPGSLRHQRSDAPVKVPYSWETGAK